MTSQESNTIEELQEIITHKDKEISRLRIAIQWWADSINGVDLSVDELVERVMND